MKINFPKLESDNPDVFIGERRRVSSLTSVSLLGPELGAACHFNGKRIYLFEFNVEQRHAKIRHSIPTTWGSKPVETDLMASSRDGLMAVTNFFQKTVTVYDTDGNKLRHVRDIVHDFGHFIHGIAFYDANTLAVTGRKQHGGVLFIDIQTSEPKFEIPFRGEHVQDVKFLSSSLALIAITRGHPTLKPANHYDSSLLLVEFEQTGKHRIIQERLFPSTHLDNIAISARRGLVTDQYNHTVHEFDLESLATLREHTGFDFPHGCDTAFNIMAVTNYGDCSLELRRL